MRACLRDVSDEQGRVSTENVRSVFQRFDIDLTETQFEEMVKKTGAEEVTSANFAGDTVTEVRAKWSAVLNYWREEGEDEI
jgi:Ca2+-binding EF-hand superfamily protein